jgi:hypothetical protein
VTDQAAAYYRPSPKPRPAGAPSRPAEAPRLRVVPPPADPYSEVPTSEPSQGGGTQTITAGQSGSTTHAGVVTSDLGFRVRISGAWARSAAYWTPPSLFTDRPASLEELAAYAKSAPWTSQDRGLLRASGVWHYRLLGYPYTVISRYREWVFQRPMRLGAHLGGIKLFALTGPGQWVVHTVVYPAAHFAGHIFL